MTLIMNIFHHFLNNITVPQPSNVSASLYLLNSCILFLIQSQDIQENLKAFDSALAAKLIPLNSFTIADIKICY